MHSTFRKAFRSLCFSVAVLVLSASLVAAEERSFQLDPAATTVSFTLGDVLHTVHGTFKARSGSIQFDPSSGAASGNFVIDATSGASGNDTRDRKMHREILESNEYPEIAFSPTKVSGSIADGASVQVAGVFHIHGADHPIELTVPVVLKGEEMTAKFHFVVPYVAWGMKNPSTFVLRVGKEVDIDVVAVGRLTAK